MNRNEPSLKKMLRSISTQLRQRHAARAFSASVLCRDIVSDLYLAQVKAYKPSVVVEKSGLAESFPFPAAPPKPEIEGLDLSTKVELEAEVAEAEWPALVDAIDDPKNYNDEWDFRTDVDSGDALPKLLKPFHYEEAH